MRLSEKVPYILLHTASSLHEVKIFYSGSKKNIQTKMLVFFSFPGVAAWGPWAQATLEMKKTAAAAPAAAPAAAASVSEYFFLDPE